MDIKELCKFFENEHENKVKHDIRASGHEKEIEGTLGISHSPENAGTDVIEHQTHDAAEIDVQIGRGLWVHIFGGVHQPEHEGRDAQTDGGKGDAQNEGHGHGSRGFCSQQVHRLRYLCQGLPHGAAGDRREVSFICFIRRVWRNPRPSFLRGRVTFPRESVV